MTKNSEPRAFITQYMRLLPAPSVPEISLYTAHPGSGLWRLLGRDNDTPPYWAYHWAGGTVLARYILDRPETVAGKRVIDLGTGSGIVGIAAAQSGAIRVVAIDIDPLAVVATSLNAERNGVTLHAVCADILTGPPPQADLILVGDLFYAPSLAEAVLPFLKMCRSADIDVLIGDPGREPLPRADLQLLANYPVADFGDPCESAPRISGVYAL
ncbi:MAG: ribosomal methyltransferase protein [Rhizobium sp.]|nr:ribosomal methyltransferase protein [Rhizobium sp.]